MLRYKKLLLMTFGTSLKCKKYCSLFWCSPLGVQQERKEIKLKFTMLAYEATKKNKACSTGYIKLKPSVEWSRDRLVALDTSASGALKMNDSG